MRAAAPVRYTAARYLALVTDGAITPEDRVELLEGLIVASPPHSPTHASGIQWACEALTRAVGARALVRAQLPLIAGFRSVPEPDVTVVPGRKEDYLYSHPTTALLVVEAADSSTVQYRLTKGPIYAAAGIPEYWLVNLRADCVEVFRRPWPARRRYREARLARRGARLGLVALPGVAVAVADLLPPTDA